MAVASTLAYYDKYGNNYDGKNFTAYALGPVL
jgi:hypothetical protein